MSYELRHEETLGENLRRIHRKQIENAIACATGAKEEQETAAIYGMRKHIKKARAVLRLVRDEIGRGLYREQDSLLRNVGRLVSDVRDAEVRLATIRQIQTVTHQRKRPAYRQMENLLGLELENFIAGFAEWEKEAVPLLERAHGAAEGWALDHFGSGQLSRSIKRSYKAARDLLDEAKEKASGECFHEFRKATKRLAYQLRILRPVNAVVLKNLNHDLAAIGGLLGRAHDLSFLAKRLEADAGGAACEAEGQRLLAVIEVSQGDLQRGAAELAERFFAERPREFVARLNSWLDDWVSSCSPSVAEALLGVT